MTDLPTVASQPINVQTNTLFLAIGNCLMAWSNVEHAVHDLFVSQVVRQSRNKQRFVIAKGIWSEIISFEARLRMTSAAINGLGCVFPLDTAFKTARIKSTAHT
jgi:hypothetical protein